MSRLELDGESRPGQVEFAVRRFFPPPSQMEQRILSPPSFDVGSRLLRCSDLGLSPEGAAQPAGQGSIHSSDIWHNRNGNNSYWRKGHINFWCKKAPAAIAQWVALGDILSIIDYRYYWILQ